MVNPESPGDCDATADRRRMNGVLRRMSVGLTGLAVGGGLLAGCGASHSATPEDEIVFTWREREFAISVWPERKAAGEPKRYTLSCTEPSGDHPDPERACEAANG